MCKKVVLLAALLSMVPMAGRSDTAGVVLAQKPDQTPVSPNLAPLTTAAEDVVKMMDAKVSEEVIKAYIDNASTLFNLTGENLIDLRKRGMPESIISAMVNHDRMVLHRLQPTQAATTNSDMVDPATVLPNNKNRNR